MKLFVSFYVRYRHNWETFLGNQKSRKDFFISNGVFEVKNIPISNEQVKALGSAVETWVKSSIDNKDKPDQMEILYCTVINWIILPEE